MTRGYSGGSGNHVSDGSDGRGSSGGGGNAITRAIILARGLGKRMREQTQGGVAVDAAQAEAADRGVKAMIPIGRPFLDYVLSALADAGYTEACLVIGPEHDAIREYYERTAPPRRMRVSFAIQAEPRGTADALLAAEAFASAPPGYLVMNADNYYPVEELRRLRELDEPGTVLFEPDALVRESNIPAERIRAFALGAVTTDGYLARLIEKPDDDDVRAMGADALVSMNFWRLDAAFLENCRRVQPSPRGELELPNAVRDAVAEGVRIRVLRGTTGVLDLSRRDDIASVAERLRDVVAEP
jgi:dTDP-glucose pyrophosphorylase